MIDFERELVEFFKSKKSRYTEKLYNAMEYALFSGGKRIRPKIMFMAAKFLGVDEKKVLPLAISLELIHNYSLIHDDLPCMDDDTYRRGRLTCHSVFGEAMALLAGDALLNLAYENAFDACVSDAELLPAANFIALNAGAEGMIGGQAMEFSFDDFDDGLITELYMKKTGALIKSAVLVPSFIAYDNEKKAALSTYADAIGLAFQLRDDVLDEDKEEKKSYLFVNGKEKTVNMLEKLNKIAAKSLARWAEGKELIELSDKLTYRSV